MVRADGTGYRQITDDAFRDRGPKWSPDGTRIGFYSDRSGRYETWTIRPTAASSSSRRRPRGPRGGTPSGRPTGSASSPRTASQTWIEDLTEPLADRKAEPLPPLEVKRALLPRSWSPDGATLAGDLEFYVSPSSVTLLYSFASRTYRALPEGAGHAGVARRQPPHARGPARPDRAPRHPVPAARARCSRCPAQGISLSRDDRWVTYIEPHSEADVWMATLEP